MNHRIVHLRTTLRDDPGSRLFFQLGDLLRKAGELHEAERVLVKGLESHPRYVAALMSLGRIQLDKAQFAEAERSFARALELDPENAIAARLIGETAERVGEAVRAIKAYKLARALMPGDAEIQARIEAIERLLAGGSEEAAPEPVVEPFEPDPAVFQESESPVQPVVPPEPFPAEVAAPEVSEPFAHAVSPRRPRELISVSEDDPFTATSTGDTGVWMVADDVFAPPESSYDTAADDVFGGQPVEEPLPEPEPEYLSPPEPEFVPAPIAEATPEPEPEFEPEPEPEPAPDFTQELSLPTVTLARLALEQDDRPLALETLKAVLDLDPENWEATQLLDQLSGDEVPEIVESPYSEMPISPAEVLAAKSARLKGWMENIRSADQRRAS